MKKAALASAISSLLVSPALLADSDMPVDPTHGSSAYVSVLDLTTSSTTADNVIYQSDDTTLKIGGRVEPRFNFSKNNQVSVLGNNDQSRFEDISRARVSLEGDTYISDELMGFGFYEVEAKEAKEIGVNTFTNRYLFAGLSTKYGNVSYGIQDSPVERITKLTDVMYTFGANASTAIDAADESVDSNFLYSLGYEGILFEVNYSAAEEKDSNSYGIAASYSLDGLTVGAGYAYQDSGQSTKPYQLSVAAAYEIDMIYLSGVYTHAKAEPDGIVVGNPYYTYNGYEFAVVVRPIDKIRVSATYNYGKYDKVLNTTADKLKADDWAADIAYEFNDSILAYVGYELNNTDGRSNETQAGILYHF